MRNRETQSAVRGSVILYLVLALAVAIGSIVLLFQATWRVRDQEARFDADQLMARYFARGAVETLAYAAELDLDQPRPPRVGGTALHDALALDAKALAAFVSNRVAATADHRGLLEMLLGSAPFRQIDAMHEGQPLARLTYHVEFTVGGKPFTGLADPVEKFVEISLEARCKLGHAEADYRNVLTAVVYSELPSVISRLTLVWPDAPPDCVNALANSVQGAVLGGPAPAVVFNSPDDFSADDPLFGGAPKPEKDFPKQQLASTVAGLETTLAHRGATYAGASGRPLTLRIASGGPPAGQYYHVYPNGPGQTYYPQASRLETQPKSLESFHPTVPGSTTVQRAWVQGAVLGTYSGIDSEGLLGPPSCGEDAGDASALLRPAGTAAHPSAGLVYGNVRAGLAAPSDLAIDRDETAADEEAQRAASGKEPPEREARDPFLRNVLEPDFQDDLRRELAGQAYGHLLPFASPGLPAGRVQNLNAALEPDPSLAILALDLAEYRYQKVFGGWDDYSRLMSRRLCVPYTTLLASASGGAAASVALLLRAAFGGAALEADVLAEARWVHTDKLHLALEHTAGHKNYVDTRVEGGKKLDALVHAAATRPRHPFAFIQCKGERLFRESFLSGNAIDLGGCEVALVAEKTGDPPPRLDLGDLQVAPGGGGVLHVSELTLKSLSNGQTGEAYSPLVLDVGRLILASPGPFEGVLLVEDSMVLQGEASPVVVKGCLYDVRGTVLAGLSKPVAAVFDPRLDPTGPQADVHYRSQVLFGAGPRIFGFGGKLVDASDYRRPAAEEIP